MAKTPIKTSVDVSKVQMDLGKFLAAVKSDGGHVGHDQATRTMAKIANNTPYLTGALFRTVTVVQSNSGAWWQSGVPGWGVTYGGGLRYAATIEKNQHPVRKGARGARTEYRKALEDMAVKQVRRV